MPSDTTILSSNLVFLEKGGQAGVKSAGLRRMPQAVLGVCDSISIISK